MDRFRFRAWDKEGKQLLEVGSLGIDFGHGYAIENEDGSVDVGTEDGNYILMQCTGLKDRNGKLIYEGDIYKNCVNGSIGQIGWDEHEACFAHGHYGKELNLSEASCFDLDYIEVIGNIYENPELLEDEDE